MSPKSYCCDRFFWIHSSEPVHTGVHTGYSLKVQSTMQGSTRGASIFVSNKHLVCNNGYSGPIIKNPPEIHIIEMQF